ncbi:M28 family peptidase [Rhizobium sp. Leaf341]|uniref:M28 family peptidase n=1 Tax=Rhizobium sp. Leaf341 TaxID=1736344 RepID=UPI000715718A|nr:M28 family peptidase [Rhizobium sp. Leaf341]KQR67852.1 hypothetical protein ASG03_10050 [Rhizobium sp. Leaf341]
MANRKLSADEKTILAMFSYKRPMGSPTEQAFIDRYLTPLGFKRDSYKNLVLRVGENPRILFSSHVDTVHVTEGIQQLHYDGATLQLAKSARATSSCLGADCTAGVWLMTEMVKAAVPGIYVIHHGEENGCIGSGDLAKGNPAFFDDIEAAIAFDRYGYTSVITHQMGRRTASDAFAASFGTTLTAALDCDCGLIADDGGAYTDTNEYARLVPECTNISVGYHSQHSKNETQHVPFLILLRDGLLAMDWSKLVIERDPSVIDYGYSRGFYRGGSSNTSSRGGWADWADLDDPWNDPQNYVLPDKRNCGSLEDLVRAYPEVAADILSSYGITRNTMMDEISCMYGEGALEGV